MEQLNIFSYILPQYKITKPIRLIELFAGIGSQAKALKNLGVNFEHHRVVEWDKYAVASYNAIHGTNFTTSDITKISGSDLGIVDTHLYDYILTYSFPCTDISLAGKMGGMSKGTNTRSGLLWEVERLLDECKELPNNFNLKSEIKEVVNLYNLGIKQYNRRTGSVVNTGGISSTLLARTQGDNNLIAFSTTQQKYSEYSIKKIQNNIIKGDIVGTITANAMQRFNHDNCHMIIEDLRIRKLTPKECWRIMGFNDEAFDKASKVNSNTQLYKQAGNSIVVNVLMEIFKELL